MGVQIPMEKLVLLSMSLMTFDIAIVHLVYRKVKYKGFIPTLSEAALTDVGSKVYAFLTPLSGLIIFSAIPIITSELLPDSEVSRSRIITMAGLCFFSYICLSYQAIVPFSKSRKLDSHTVMAGLFMLGVLVMVSYYTYLGWTAFILEQSRRVRCLVVRLGIFAVMAYCVLSVLPFMFGVLQSRDFKESRVILRHDVRLLNKMGLLQLVAMMTLPAFLVSTYWEAKGLYLVVRNDM